MFYLYLLFFLMVAFIEVKMWKALTPLIIAFSGITAISILHSAFGSYLGFIDVNPEVFLYIAYFLGIAFASSAFVFLIANASRTHRTKALAYQFGQTKESGETFSKKAVSYKANLIATSLIPGKIFNNNLLGYLFLCAVFFLCIFLMYSVRRAYFSAGQFMGEEFEQALSYGIAGHSFALLMACVPFLYLFSKFSESRKVRILSLIFFIISLCLLFTKQVKYWVIVPVVWVFIISVTIYGFNFSKSLIYKSMGGGVVVLVLFFIVYFFQVVSGNDGVEGLDIYELLLNISYHFLGYIFSGLLVFSSLIDDGVFNGLDYRDAAIAFEGLLNIFKVIMGGGAI